MATLTALIHGEAGAGKSWLGDTAPAPRLILDAEGRAPYTPSAPKAFWDVAHYAPPENDGGWQTCVATIQDFDELQLAYQWLASRQHPFRSVVVDSLMEVQMRFIDKHSGLNPLNQQDWGTVLRHLENLVRSYRDLALDPQNPVEVVVFTAGTTDADGVRRPLVQGQLKLKVPYFLDVVGYLYVTAGESGALERHLMVQPTTQVVAKEGTGKLPGPVIVNPNLTTMYEQLNGGGQA
jgi:hypothetical protein